MINRRYLDMNEFMTFSAKVIVGTCLFFSVFGSKIDAVVLGESATIKSNEIKIVRNESIKPYGVQAGVARELSEIILDCSSSYDVSKHETDFVQSSSEPAFVELDKTMYLNTKVNLRSDASTDSEVLCKIDAGRDVYVSGYYDDEWYSVSYDGKAGYIYSEYLQDENPVFKVSSTAYYDEYKRHSASMRELQEGYSVAGKVEWLNKYLLVYACNEDGTVGKLLGEYRFDDTGYGAESGVGESSILEGRSIGTIENGTCIDFFFESEADCINYGRRDVYIMILDK